MNRIALMGLVLLATACYPDSTCTDCADTASDTGVDTSDSTDSDSDTISDQDEGNGRDTDHDGVPDMLDDDSDGDGIPDAVEAGDDDVSTAPRDSDSDGRPDFIDEDSDANGIDDGDEPDTDVDGDGQPDRIDMDDDDDGCIDPREGSANHDDSDGDGIFDHADDDSDGDGITDEQEGCLDDCDHDFIPNRVDLDSDGSGVPDEVEGAVDTDADTDTGPDGVLDYCDRDNDGDGIEDIVEIETWGTDPQLWDTDGDGDFDYLEIVVGSDPLDGTDSVPDDLIIVGPLGTPLTYDVTTSLPRLDLAIVAGTGGDTADETADLMADLPASLDALRTVIPDVELSIVAFEDFGEQGYGPPEAEPFTVIMRSSGGDEDIAAGLTALNTRASLMDGSIETRACGVEAVFQAITGEGMGTLVGHASCASSPLDPARFGAACMREDSYSIIMILSDRLSWSPQGCLSIDTTCTYDEDLFPIDVVLHRYPETIDVAADRGVRVAGLLPDPDATSGTDHRTWVQRFGADTGTVDGDGEVVIANPGSDASQATELMMQALSQLVTSSPFDATSTVVDLPDGDPQPEGIVLAYGLAAYPVSCTPATGDWGTCMFEGKEVTGVGPGVEVTIRLLYTPPSVHPSVDVLAFEVQIAVEGRMVIDRRKGYLVVPQTWDPSL